MTRRSRHQVRGRRCARRRSRAGHLAADLVRDGEGLVARLRRGAPSLRATVDGYRRLAEASRPRACERSSAERPRTRPGDVLAHVRALVEDETRANEEALAEARGSGDRAPQMRPWMRSRSDAAQTYPCRRCGTLRTYRRHDCVPYVRPSDSFPLGTWGRGSPARGIVLTQHGWAQGQPRGAAEARQLMTWVRLADDFYRHPKVLSARLPLAGWLWVCGLAYANHYLTDGHSPRAAVRGLTDVDEPFRLALTLVEAGSGMPWATASDSRLRAVPAVG